MCARRDRGNQARRKKEEKQRQGERERAGEKDTHGASVCTLTIAHTGVRTKAYGRTQLAGELVAPN